MGDNIGCPERGCASGEVAGRMDCHDRRMALNRMSHWCRTLEYSDDGDDGIGRVKASFRIRDERETMRELYEGMTLDEAADVMCDIVLNVAEPCDGFFADWKDPECTGFCVDWEWDEARGSIVMSATFRS